MKKEKKTYCNNKKVKEGANDEAFILGNDDCLSYNLPSYNYQTGDIKWTNILKKQKSV